MLSARVGGRGLTSMRMRRKPAVHCQMPATIHTGEMVRQADTPNTIATGGRR